MFGVVALVVALADRRRRERDAPVPAPAVGAPATAVVTRSLWRRPPPIALLAAGVAALTLAGAALVTVVDRSAADEKGPVALPGVAGPVGEQLVDDPAAGPGVSAIDVTPGQDVPNPFVVVHRGTYLLFASQVDFWAANVPVRAASRLGAWGPIRDAMATMPSWATRGFTWAPDVRQFGDHWVLYFTARLAVPWRVTQCIGVAVADEPTGPYLPARDPLVCQLDHKGSIDARSFVDADGTPWLHWKSDDNARGSDDPAAIWAQRLTRDGTGLVGPVSRLIVPDQQWEKNIVEAPQMVLDRGRYWLFYSGNWFNQPDYGIGLAECTGPAGPCTKVAAEAWLGSSSIGAGPGEASLFQDARGWWIAFAPWAVRYRTDTARPVAIGRVMFGPNGPVYAGAR